MVAKSTRDSQIFFGIFPTVSLNSSALLSGHHAGTDGSELQCYFNDRVR